MASRVGNYLLFDTLGTGTFAKVKRAVDERTGEEVAVKVMEKESIASMNMTSNVRREIAIMKALTHENIVRLRQVLASHQRLYLVMDYVQGGELFTKIHRDGAVTEHEGRLYFRQLVAGVAYCHSRGVVHRDLKPENLLLDSRTSQLKIADFGLSGLSQMAAGVEGDQLLHTQCGSPNYCAPEILEPSTSRSGYNGALADTWSVGVILYVLLAGRLPFYDPDPRRLYEAIANSPVQFPPNFPRGAADIVRRLLVKEPTGRLSLEDVQRHPWFVVGLEPPPKRRQRRSSRSQPAAAAGNGSTSTPVDEDPSSGQAASSRSSAATSNGTVSSTDSSGTPTVVTIDGSEEAVQAQPPRSVLPTATLGSNPRGLLDEDPSAMPARDAATAGRTGVGTGGKPPRPSLGSEPPEVVTVLARRNGWGDTRPQEKRSTSADELATPGANGTSALLDAELAGVRRRHTVDTPAVSDGPVPPLDVNYLNDPMGSADHRLPVPSPGCTTSTPCSPSVENGATSPVCRSLSADALTPGSSHTRLDDLRATPVTRVAGKPPSPPRRPPVPIRDPDYTSANGPTLGVVDDADLDREASELLFHDEHLPSMSGPAGVGALQSAASDRFSVAPTDDYDPELSLVSDAFASSAISGAPSRPPPSTRVSPYPPSMPSTQFGNRFASGNAVPRDSAVTSSGASSSAGERRDSLGSNDSHRPDPRTLQSSPATAQRAVGRGMPLLSSLGAGALASSGSGYSGAPSSAGFGPPGRMSGGGGGQPLSFRNQEESRRGRAGVRVLLGLAGSNEPPSFVTALPARECLRTIGVILSDMGLTVFLKKNQNKMKCQVGELNGLPMWASICYVEGEGTGLNSVVFKRAREDHSRINHPSLKVFCDRVHTQYRHAVEMSAVRAAAAEAAREQAT